MADFLGGVLNSQSGHKLVVLLDCNWLIKLTVTATRVAKTMKNAELPKIPSQRSNQLRAAWKRIVWRIKVSTVHAVKRTLDICVVMPALLLLSPLFLVVALCIRLYDGGPVLYWQKRVGRRGREFAFPKFRSMCVDSDAMRAKVAAMNQHGAAGVTFKMKRDPRITPIGRVIRRFSIDELPQLWCVLTGQMTLVGPRPPIPSEVAQYSLRDRERLSVVPGLTCFWQVNGRSEIPFEQQVEMDIDYIHQRSLWTDIKVLFKTIPAVIFGRGAY
jgi:lipopolysaccharide/colanic/teichoic acid biosynthesis glycosyltransferase